MDKIQDEIIEEFSVFDDWLDKYDYLIGLSETLPPISPEHRTGQYLIRVLNGRTPQEILDTELYFIDAIGLSANLSPTRANGLVSMIKQMRLYALAFQAKDN